MKNIYYTLSNFHKAVKRNKPSTVFYNDVTCEFWFFTQKANINYAADDFRVSQFLIDWLYSNGVKFVEWI